MTKGPCFDAAGPRGGGFGQHAHALSAATRRTGCGPVGPLARGTLGAHRKPDRTPAVSRRQPRAGEEYACYKSVWARDGVPRLPRATVHARFTINRPDSAGNGPDSRPTPRYALSAAARGRRSRDAPATVGGTGPVVSLPCRVVASLPAAHALSAATRGRSPRHPCRGLR